MARTRAVITFVCVGIMVTFLGINTSADEQRPQDIKNVGITENIGATLPLDLAFTNEEGQRVILRDYLKNDKVVILNLVYFNCPMLCDLVLKGISDAVRETSSVKLGKKYEIVSISIDPKDTPKQAKQFQQKYAQLARISTQNPGWHFLTGDAESVKKISKSVGFGYAYNSQTKEYAHAASLFIITPEGKISRYLYGILYKPFDFKMAILEASNGQLISSVERVLLFCYNYDAHKRGYVLKAMNAMKVGAGLTLLILGGFLVWLNIKYKDKK